MPSVLLTVSFTANVAFGNATTNPSSANRTFTRLRDKVPNDENNTSLSPFSLSHCTNFQLPATKIIATTAASIYLNRRAAQNKYRVFASVIKTANDTDLQGDCQELVQTRLKHMLTVAAARSLRILTFSLQKCNANPDPLASAARSSDETRAHMRVIKAKFFMMERLQ